MRYTIKPQSRALRLSRPLAKRDAHGFRVPASSADSRRAPTARTSTITVHSGPPPGLVRPGRTLYEADAVLQVGFKLRDMLTQAGANVVMYAHDPEPSRSRVAGDNQSSRECTCLRIDPPERFFDGVDGSIRQQWFPHAILLAAFDSTGRSDYRRRCSTSLVCATTGLGSREHRRRPRTSMPSVLTEGAFVPSVPEQEAALRTTAYQAAYATAILRETSIYFASSHGSVKMVALVAALMLCAARAAYS